MNVFYSRIALLGLLTMHVVGPDFHSVLENNCLGIFGWLFTVTLNKFNIVFKCLNIDFGINEYLRSSFISTHAFPLIQKWSGVKLVLDILRCLFLPSTSALFKIYLLVSSLFKAV